MQPMATNIVTTLRAVTARLYPLFCLVLAACHKLGVGGSGDQQQFPSDDSQAAMMAQLADVQAAMHPATNWWVRILCILAGAIVGALIGAFFSKRARMFRAYIVLALVVLLLIYGIYASDISAFVSSGIAGGVIAYTILSILTDSEIPEEPPFGNARPANRLEVTRAGHIGSTARDSGKKSSAIPLGFFLEPNSAKRGIGL
jgi:hypothetical protein